jgi:hypothetical protein
MEGAGFVSQRTLGKVVDVCGMMSELLIEKTKAGTRLV